MKTTNEVLHIEDAAELAAKQEAAEFNYRSRINGYDQSLGIMSSGAIEVVQCMSRTEALEKYVELTSNGYSRNKAFDSVTDADKRPFITLYMNRPEKDLKPEIKAIKQEVEVSYRAEIARLNSEIIRDQAEKMLDLAKRKRAEDQAKAEAEELKRYVDEVTQTLKVA